MLICHVADYRSFIEYDQSPVWVVDLASSDSWCDECGMNDNESIILNLCLNKYFLYYELYNQNVLLELY